MYGLLERNRDGVVGVGSAGRDEVLRRRMLEWGDVTYHRWICMVFKISALREYSCLSIQST